MSLNSASLLPVFAVVHLNTPFQTVAQCCISERTCLSGHMHDIAIGMLVDKLVLLSPNGGASCITRHQILPANLDCIHSVSITVFLTMDILHVRFHYSLL